MFRAAPPSLIILYRREETKEGKHKEASEGSKRRKRGRNQARTSKERKNENRARKQKGLILFRRRDNEEIGKTAEGNKQWAEPSCYRLSSLLHYASHWIILHHQPSVTKCSNKTRNNGEHTKSNIQ